MLTFSISGNRWLDRLERPALLAQGRTIQYCNPAALRLLPGLKEGTALPAGLPEEDAVITECLLEGRRWIISASDTEAGRIYLFRSAQEDGALERTRVGQLSGQLRLLLGRINLSAEALQEALVETEQLRNRMWIARLNRSRYQLLRVINNLDFCCQTDESLRLLYPPETLEMVSLCQELERETEALAELLGRKLVCRLPKKTVLVSANRELLRRLLLNLLTNSFQSQGDVTLRLTVQKEAVCLTLTDTGGGIRPERLSQAFSPENGLEEVPEPGAGCGFGLAVCRKIALLCGGQLLLSSDGQGTRISLSLSRCGEDFLLRGGLSCSSAESANQVLTELSPVLPPECFLQEDL